MLKKSRVYLFNIFEVYTFVLTYVSYVNNMWYPHKSKHAKWYHRYITCNTKNLEHVVFIEIRMGIQIQQKILKASGIHTFAIFQFCWHQELFLVAIRAFLIFHLAWIYSIYDLHVFLIEGHGSARAQRDDKSGLSRRDTELFECLSVLYINLDFIAQWVR